MPRVCTKGDVSPTREDIPESLLDVDQWRCWREAARDGKPTMIPIDPSTGEFASTTDAETWASFQTAREQITFGDEDGDGFVFTDDDPFVGVDLDDCRVPESETTLAWATAIIEQLDSDTEVSPWGTGFHILATDDFPDGLNRAGDVELYDDARSFTVTGDRVDGTPQAFERRDEAVTAVHGEYVAAECNDNHDPDVTGGESSIR